MEKQNEQSEVIFSVAVVNSGGYADGRDSDVFSYASRNECLNRTYLQYQEARLEARENGVLEDGAGLLTSELFERRLVEGGCVYIQCLDSHINFDYFEKELFLQREAQNVQRGANDTMVFRGDYTDVKRQFEDAYEAGDKDNAGALLKHAVPDLSMEEASQLYAELRGEIHDDRVVYLKRDGEAFDISNADYLSKDELYKVVAGYVGEREEVESPLMRFIEQEVPFRLLTILESDVTDEERAILINLVKENTDVLFDYDKIDGFLEDQLEKIRGLNSEKIHAVLLEMSNLRHELEGALMYDPDQAPGIDRRLCQLQAQLDALRCNNDSIFIFDEDVLVNDDFESVNGYLWAVDALVDRLPDAAEQRDNINFYADYNVKTGEIKVSSLCYLITDDAEINETHDIPLSDAEKVELISTFDQYCRYLGYGDSCLELVNEVRKGEGIEPVQPSLTCQISSLVVQSEGNRQEQSSMEMSDER